MPEHPVNSPRSPHECVTTLVSAIERNQEAGLCEECAIRMAAKRYGVAYGKALVLYLEREHATSE